MMPLQVRLLLKSCLIAVSSFAATAAHGALQWTHQDVTLQAGLDEKTVQAVYPFRNTGDQPVKILAIKTSCGCTTAALPRETYAAGETGEIKVGFEIGGFTGRQEKLLWVSTDASPDHPDELRLIVEIPQLLTIEPRLVWWRLGETGTEKTVAIAVHPETRVEITGISSTDPAISHRLEQVTAHDYRLHLQPTTTAKSVRATVTLQIVPENLAPRTMMVFAQVR